MEFASGGDAEKNPGGQDELCQGTCHKLVGSSGSSITLLFFGRFVFREAARQDNPVNAENQERDS